MTFSRAASASKNAWVLAPAVFLLAAAEARTFALLAAARPGTCGSRKRAIENAGDLRESTGTLRFAPCSLGSRLVADWKRAENYIWLRRSKRARWSFELWSWALVASPTACSRRPLGPRCGRGGLLRNVPRHLATDPKRPNRSRAGFESAEKKTRLGATGIRTLSRRMRFCIDLMVQQTQR